MHALIPFNIKCLKFSIFCDNFLLHYILHKNPSSNPFPAAE